MKVQVPTSLKDITLAKWLEVQEVYKVSTEEILTKMKVIQIICNIPFDVICDIAVNDIDKIYSTIELMFNQEIKIENFELNGIEYGFIPNLEEMSGAEFIDLEKYLKEEDALSVMAVLYRPIVKKVDNLYQIEKYKGAEKNRGAMVNAPSYNYVAATFFFMNLLKELMIGIPNYIQSNLTTSEVQTLESAGVGISQLTQLLQGID